MWYFLYQKAQTVDLPFLFFTADDRVRPGRIDIGMSQKVGQMADVFFRLIIGNGKEMPEIMRKYFVFVHFCIVTEFFHGMEDIAAVQRLSAAGDKDASGPDVRRLDIGGQLQAQSGRQQHDTRLSFQRHDCPSGMQRLYCYIWKLADPDPGSAQRLHEHAQLMLSPASGRLHKPDVFFPGQFPLFCPEYVFLHFKRLDGTFFTACGPQKAVYRRQFGIDAADGVPAGQPLLVQDYSFFCNPAALDSGCSSGHFPGGCCCRVFESSFLFSGRILSLHPGRHRGF